MNYDDPQTLDLVAREYVLGTLRGAARRRFARLVHTSPQAARAVAAWEETLAPLSHELEARMPPRRVWKNIERATGLAGSKQRLWDRREVWQALAAGLAVVALLLGVRIVTEEPRLVPETLVAIVADEADTPLWLIRGDPGRAELRINALQSNVPPAGRDFELWMLPDDGTAPVSLGLLPASGAVTRDLDAARLAVLTATSTLAVSLEPAGGSLTGAPTGPVLYTAPLVRGG